MNKKVRRLYAKFIILILCFLIVIRIFILALSKYESQSNAEANINIAYYLFKEDYKKMTLNLDLIEPRENKYIYTFSIGNQDVDKTAEIDLKYDLTIRTTTNLPLTYKLYMNQEYNAEDATEIVKTNEIAPDEDGTYFRTITTDTSYLKYTEPKTNIYQLVIYFPKVYNTENYQDIIESLEIIVKSEQVTE